MTTRRQTRRTFLGGTALMGAAALGAQASPVAAQTNGKTFVLFTARGTAAGAGGGWPTGSR